MTGSPPPNAKLQERIETVIRVLAPVLDLVIVAGDRTSRLLDRAGGRPYTDPAGPERQLAGAGPRSAQATSAEPARY